MPAPETHRHRIRSAAFSVTMIGVGLVVHRMGLGLNATTRDMLGDALWAMMIFFGFGALFPTARWMTRAAAALAICAGVEVSQLYHRNFRERDTGGDADDQADASNRPPGGEDVCVGVPSMPILRYEPAPRILVRLRRKTFRKGTQSPTTAIAKSNPTGSKT
jgi:hypothetical protein